jgi:DNA-binding NarL/FixJ family response regulator
MTTRILIADDHAIVRDGLKRILESEPDWTVVSEAKDGDEALAAARGGDADVVLLDLSMPGRSGIDLVRQIKADRPELKILVLSMHDAEQYAVRAIRAGASGYLTKDSASSQLVSALRKVASGGLYITAGVAEQLARGLQAPAHDLPHRRLSDREYEVFMHLVGGESVTAIAERLHLSVKTVSTHKTHILEKMRVGSVAELVRYAVAHRLVDDPDLAR